MKRINQIGALLVFAMIGSGLGQARADSIVQITAEVQGLEQITPDAWAPYAAYWEAMPGAIAFAPLPCAPFDTTLPVYAIADGQYLVDGTGSELPRGDTVAAMETVSNAVVNLINQIQGTQIAHAMRAMGMDSPETSGSGDDGGGYTAGSTNYYFYSINTNLLWLQITNASLETAYVNLYHATDQVYAIWSTTNLALPLTNWQVETEVFSNEQHHQSFALHRSDLGAARFVPAGARLDGCVVERPAGLVDVVLFSNARFDSNRFGQSGKHLGS